MQRILRTLLVAGFLSIACAVGASAQSSAPSVTVDLSKISPDDAAKILEIKKRLDEVKAAPAAPVVSVEDAEKWSKIGQNVAQAIGATAKELSIDVNDFIKTPVGKWVVFFIFWYVIGHKLWAIVGGIFIWIVLGAVILRSFRRFHYPQRVLASEKDGVKQYGTERYPFKSDDARTTSACFHAAAFVLLSIAMSIVIL